MANYKYGYIDPTSGQFRQVTGKGQIADNAIPIFYDLDTGQYFVYHNRPGDDAGTNDSSREAGIVVVETFLNSGTVPSGARNNKVLIDFKNNNGGADLWNSYKPGEPLPTGLQGYVTKSNLTPDGKPSSPKEEAFNNYYDDWNNYEDPNSQGGKVLRRLEESYENKANTDILLAEATMQQQALQQAQTVKAITDQVRAERMARLKAGMSESQIANQDMQMMMANVNALNQNAAMVNQAKLGAQANQMMAKDQAFADYLGQSLQGSQIGAAYSAADAGNPSMQVREYMRNNPNVSYSQAWQIVTGQNLNK